MNKVKIIAGAIVAVGVFLTPIFSENVNKTEMLYKWKHLNTSISHTTWELDESIGTESDKVEDYKIITVNQSKSFKSYMSYTSITDKTSTQYKVRQLAYTDEYGFRKIEDRYCVAVGTSITSTIGTYIDVVLQNGTVIPCVVGDIKADIDTNSDNITTSSNGCVCEYLVDTKMLPRCIKRTGNISNCYEEWMSPVEKIVVYERSVFDEQRSKSDIKHY